MGRALTLKGSLFILAIAAIATAQTVNPGRVNVVTTPWSVNWLTHNADGPALTDLGFSAWMQTIIGPADANELRPDLDLGWINVKDDPYLATGDGVADDTAAVQAAIDAAHAERVAGRYEPIVFFPDGKYRVGNLTIYNGTRLQGAGPHHSYIEAAVGTTGNLIEDTSGVGIYIADLTIDGNNVADCNGLYLGYGTDQFGSFSKLERLHIRNFDGFGAKVRGNASWFDTIAVAACNNNGLIIQGTSNQWQNLSATSCEPNSIWITGQFNTLRGVHLEADPDNHIWLNATADGTSISDVFASMSAGNDPNSIIYLASGTTQCTFHNIRLSWTAPSAAPANGLIHDASSATERILWGNNTAGYYSIEHYRTGSGYVASWALSAAPTTGTWLRGDVVFNSSPDPGDARAWVCTAPGTPGTWADLVQYATTGLYVSNGATGVGFIDIYEDSDDGTNYLRLQGGELGANRTVALKQSLAVQTVIYTIDVDDDASTDDYQFDDDAANTTEQVKTVASALPAYAALVSWQVRCFESVTGYTAMQIDVGTTSGGAELGTGSPDTANDIIGTTAGEAPELAATNAARSIYFSGTPGANWNTLNAGRWDLILSYIDYNAIHASN